MNIFQPVFHILLSTFHIDYFLNLFLLLFFGLYDTEISVVSDFVHKSPSGWIVLCNLEQVTGKKPTFNSSWLTEWLAGAFVETVKVSSTSRGAICSILFYMRYSNVNATICFSWVTMQGARENSFSTHNATNTLP